MWRLVFALTQPPAAPIRQAALYYAVLGALLFALHQLFPGLGEQTATGGAELGTGASAFFEMSTSRAGAAPTELAVLFALSGALLFTLPLSWTYMGTRRKKGFDQAVAQTIVLLPIAVAGIVVVVQDSIALAFSLAGIVAAVRFRTTLKKVSDALYIFAAVGVGLACGVGAVGVAGLISGFFNFTILILWHCDYATCPKAGPVAEFSSGKLLEKAAAAAPAVAGASGKDGGTPG